MTRLRITGGRLIDPASGHDAVGDLCIVDGRITAVGATPDGFTADREIDATGRIVCPGLIDLCARLGEPGGGQHARIASEAMAAAAGGITTLVCPPDTRPVIDSASVVELIHRRAADADAARVRPLGALTRELAGEQLAEMASLMEAGCAGLADGGHPVADTLVLRRALEYAATVHAPVVLTPTDPWLAAAGCMHEGPVATRLGLPGIPRAAESAGLARALAIAESVEYGVHVGRLSTRDALERLRNGPRNGLTATADTGIAHLFFTEQDAATFDARFHVRPPLRTTGDRDALRAGLADGSIAAICSDHTPLDDDAKEGPFEATRAGMSTLDCLLPLMLRLVEEEVLDLHRALAAVTCGPADVLGLPSGRLAPDAPGDICVFDPDAVWWCRPETLRSASHQSPFLGWELTGRATHTVVGGRLVYQSDEQA